MKLSTREKLMLVVLAAVALIVASYYFLFQPQIDKIQALKAEDANNKAMMEAMQRELESGGQLDAQVNELNAKLAEKTRQFYPEALQDKLILAFDEILARTGTTSDSYTFGPLTASQAAAPQTAETQAQSSAQSRSPTANDIAAQYNQILGIADGQPAAQPVADQSAAQKPDTQVQYMNVSLKISGTYDGVMNFIKELEASNKAIRINDLNITMSDTGMATGSISVDFYTLPLILGEGQ